MVSVLLEYIDLFNIFNQTLPIMLALCLMLLGTYYAQNYAGIIGASLFCVALVCQKCAYSLTIKYQTPKSGNA